MIREMRGSFQRLFRFNRRKMRGRGRRFSACPLPIPNQHRTPPLNSVSDHDSFCLSLADQLIRRGLLPLANDVIRRIIVRSSSVIDAISAYDFASVRGIEFDSSCYGALMRKLLSFSEYKMGKALYHESVRNRGTHSDAFMLNSMVFCCCQLGELEEARIYYDKLIEMDHIPVKDTCNILIQKLCEQDELMDALDYFVEINNVGTLLGFRCYNMLVNGLCDRGCIDEALYVFDTMLERGVPPTLHLYKSLVHGFCKKMNIVQAMLLCAEMESHGFCLDKVIYTNLIRVYSQTKELKMAMLVFLRMLKMGCEPDTHTYNTLIHGFFNLGMPEKGWILHNQMVEVGIKPNTITYNIMISRYCKEQNIDCALKLLDVSPSVHSYTNIISTLCKHNRLTEVNDLLHQMLEKRIVPDHVLFFTLLKRQPKGKEISLALSLLQKVHHIFISSTLDVEIDYLLDKILRTNIDLAGTALNIYTMALCASGKRAEASLYLDKMVSHEIQPLISTYNSLIKCLFQEGLINDAKYLLEVMQNKGMVPDMVTYLIMVNECCKKGDVESAYGILDQICARGIKPSVAIYDCVIGCLSRKRKIFEAVDVFKRMLEDGVDPDRTIFVTMINAFSKSGRAVYARQVFDKMVEMGIQPDDRAYTALINGLIGKNMLSKGCLYLDKMFQDGLVPNNVFYTCMINQSLKKRELDFALRLFDLMEWSQIEADLVTYIALISGVGRNIRPTSRRYISCWNSNAKEDLFGLLQNKNVLMKPSRRNLKQFLPSQEVKMWILSKLIPRIKETKYLPNLYLYNGIINSLCSANMADEAYDHLGQMLRDGLQPNHMTFTILIDHHIRSNEISKAIELFTMMDETGCIPDMILYNTLIKGLCKSGQTFYALLLLYKRGFYPSKEAYENLLQRFCIDCSTVYAVRIVEDMLAHDFVPSHYNLRNLSRLQDTSVPWEMIDAKKAMLEERKLIRRGNLLDFLNPASSSSLILSYRPPPPQQRSFGLLS